MRNYFLLLAINCFLFVTLCSAEIPAKCEDVKELCKVATFRVVQYKYDASKKTCTVSCEFTFNPGSDLSCPDCPDCKPTNTIIGCGTTPSTYDITLLKVATIGDCVMKSRTVCKDKNNHPKDKYKIFGCAGTCPPSLEVTDPESTQLY
jgi:hypothetical protein